jgi:hypothetical protein
MLKTQDGTRLLRDQLAWLTENATPTKVMLGDGSGTEERRGNRASEGVAWVGSEGQTWIPLLWLTTPSLRSSATRPVAPIAYSPASRFS